MIAEMVLRELIDQDHARQVQLARARRCYEGKFDKPLNKSNADPLAKDNVMMNYAAPIVNKGVSFLMGNQVTFEIEGDSESDEKSPDQLYLDGTWKQNKQMCLLHNMAQNGGITGDVLVKMMPPSPGKKYPRLINLDPATVTPVLGTDDIDDVQGWLIQWNCVEGGKPAVRRQIISREVNSWEIVDQISRGNSNTWLPLGTAIWPFAWSPIFHCNNLPEANVFWGVSDIEAHVLSVNDAINMTMSNMARILRMHAHPKVWGRGFNANTMDMSVDSLTILPSGTAELKSLEMQSDLASSITMYEKLKECLFEVAGIPEISIGKVDKIGQLSGVALKILYQSILEKNGTKQLFYGAMFEELNMRLLEYGGLTAETDIKITWQDPLPVDKAGETTNAAALSDLGVSKQTLLTELGYDPEEEAERKSTETTNDAAMGAAMLDAFGKGQ